MKAFITVIGRDKVGIIAQISNFLAELNINIEDISQTILQDMFSMIMAVDISKCDLNFTEISDRLKAKGQTFGMDITIRSTEIFNAMHRI